MSEGHGRAAWAHTSLVCALLVNVNRDRRKGRPAKPDDFNPYAHKQGTVIEVTKETMGRFRHAFGQPEREPQKTTGEPHA